MADTYTLRNFLICDEVREEVGGKQIIIGAYAGAILLPMIPYVARIFTVRFEVTGHRNQYNAVSCTIWKPDMNVFFHNTIPYTLRYPEFPVAIYFPMLYQNFDQTGEYTVSLSMDSDPEPVGTFRILTSAELPPVS